MLSLLSEEMDVRLSNITCSELDVLVKIEKLFQSQFNFFNHNRHFVVAVFSDGLLEKTDEINFEINKLMDIKSKHLKLVLKEGQKQKKTNI